MDFFFPFHSIPLRPVPFYSIQPELSCAWRTIVKYKNTRCERGSESELSCQKTQDNEDNASTLTALGREFLRFLISNSP